LLFGCGSNDEDPAAGVAVHDADRDDPRAPAFDGAEAIGDSLSQPDIRGDVAPHLADGCDGLGADTLVCGSCGMACSSPDASVDAPSVSADAFADGSIDSSDGSAASADGSMDSLEGSPVSDVSIDSTDAASPIDDASNDVIVSIGPQCNCGSSNNICGSGAVNDPWRCCDLSKDSCNDAPNNNPCTPWRCNPSPDCCVLLTCGGCASAIDRCIAYLPNDHFAPDNTPCNDNRSCTAADPAPTAISCLYTNGSSVSGPGCTKDLDCDSAEGGAGKGQCSGTGSSSPGGPSSIIGGRCCPPGMACNFASGTCWGNNGVGGAVGGSTNGSTNDNDACHGGRCLGSNYAACPG
jgi:hypothetical protein